MNEIKDISKVIIKKNIGDIVQRDKNVIIKGGLTPPPENHPNGRDCPQCFGWTWRDTSECLHCGCNLKQKDVDILRKQQELIDAHEKKIRDQTEQFNQPKTLWDIHSDDLFIEHVHCKNAKWKVYSKRILPFSLSVCGLLISVYLIVFHVFPNMFKLSTTSWYLMFGIIICGSLIPTFWLNFVRNRDDKLIRYYEERIELINHILRVRGD